MKASKQRIAAAMKTLSRNCSKVKLTKWVSSLPGPSRSREEKRLAVKACIKKHRDKSSREIAKICGVSHTLVENMRA